MRGKLFRKLFCDFMRFLNSFLVGFMQFFYDLSSLGNFYSSSVDIIVLLFLVGLCTFCMYTLCSLSIFLSIGRF